MRTFILKNVSLVLRESNGKDTWRLLGPDGLPIRAFDVFAKAILRLPYHTRRSYSRWLAEFLDYLFEASQRLEFEKDGAVGREFLRDVIEAYDDYLVLGTDAGSPIAIRISQTLPSPLVSRRSSATMNAWDFCVQLLLPTNCRLTI